jgi:hypothetical protein
MQESASPLANPHPHVLVEEPEAVLERKLKLRLMRGACP